MTQKRHGINNRWPMVLQKLLGDEYRVIEEGCNGRTAYNIVEDNPWKTGDYGMKAILNSHKPVDLLIFMLGSNDLKTLYDSSPRDIADAMAGMLKEAAQFMLDQQEFVPEFLLISPPLIDERIGETFFGDEFDSTSAERSRQMADVLKQVAENFQFEGRGCHFLNAAEHVMPSSYDCLHLEQDQHLKLAKAICDLIQSGLK
ncbi:MAG: GDSL-type esterase/lipase family protein [Clostridia bacterium]|nr:GDSL-type esterase/lipase family protein [Clostridia bacterium]